MDGRKRNEKVDRNAEIVRKHQEGKTFRALSREYDISPTRVKAIWDREQSRLSRQRQLFQLWR